MKFEYPLAFFDKYNQWHKIFQQWTNEKSLRNSVIKNMRRSSTVGKIN